MSVWCLRVGSYCRLSSCIPTKEAASFFFLPHECPLGFWRKKFVRIHNAPLTVRIGWEVQWKTTNGMESFECSKEYIWLVAGFCAERSVQKEKQEWMILLHVTLYLQQRMLFSYLQDEDGIKATPVLASSWGILSTKLGRPDTTLPHPCRGRRLGATESALPPPEDMVRLSQHSHWLRVPVLKAVPIGVSSTTEILRFMDLVRVAVTPSGVLCWERTRDNWSWVIESFSAPWYGPNMCFKSVGAENVSRKD